MRELRADYRASTCNDQNPRGRIVLVQPFWGPTAAEQDGWDLPALESHVASLALGERDTAVFPECYPWWPEQDASTCVTLDVAQSSLGALARSLCTRIIAGGILAAGGRRYNATLFASPHRAEVQTYFKRILWTQRGESEATLVEAGALREGRVFDDGVGCPLVPLICADVFGSTVRESNEPTDAMRAVVFGTRDLVSNHPGARVVVCSYGKRPFGRRWTTRLTELARAVSADVLYCNFAGVDGAGFGGGGSGVFASDGRRLRRLGRQRYVVYEH